MTYQLQLFGNPKLLTPNGMSVLERKTAAVLAFLALEGATHKYKLAGWLWANSGETAARNNMRQLLRRLRLAAGEVVLGEDQIALHPDVSVDVQRLSSLQNPTLEVLSQNDELLADLEYDDAPDFDEWLLGVREELKSLRLRAAQIEADRLEKSGQLRQALEFAQFRIKLEVLSEEAYRQVARLQYLLGDRSAALATLERCRTLLDEELGIEPLPQTLELLGLIERGALMGTAPKPKETVLPTAILRPPVLAGRMREWALMEEAWQRGQIIYLEGEPGVGKSRLALDFANSKGKVFHFQARPGDAGIPFATQARAMREMIAQNPGILERIPRWAHLELGRLLPELGGDETLPPLASETEKLRFFEAIGEVVLAQEAFVTITVADDVQFADTATVESTGYLMTRFSSSTKGRSPRIINVYRRSELLPEIEAGLNQGIEAGVLAKITVEPLATNAIEALLNGLGLEETTELTQGLLRYTGGNPMFILETLKHLMESGTLAQGLPSRLTPPGKVAALIGRRLQRLSAPALGLARSAAVAKTSFDLQLATSVLERGVMELAEAHAELETALVLRGNAFTHDLVFEAVLASIPNAIKQVLHGNTAAYLEGKNANPALIAQHWEESGNADKTAQWLIQAARNASALGLYSEVIELLERAIAKAHSKALKLEAQVILADSLGPMGRVEESIALAQTVLKEAEDPSFKQRALSVLQNMYQGIGRYQEAEVFIAQALELAEQLGEHDRADGMRFAQARVLRYMGRYSEALALLERIRPRYEAQMPGSDLIQILTLLGNTYNLLGQHLEAEPLLRRAYALSQESLGPALLMLSLSNLLYGLICQGKPQELLAESETALELGSYAIADNLRNHLALAYLRLAQNDDAERHFQVLAENSFDPNYRCIAWARLAGLTIETQTAIEHARALLPNAHTPSAKFLTIQAAILHGSLEQRDWGTQQLETFDSTLLPWLFQLEFEQLSASLKADYLP
jgi:DNA-binding SARP family transcriptional activator/predicted ATPase